ncbi:hypothetical protein RJ641_022165, partial [Dillenia turbinata]
SRGCFGCFPKPIVITAIDDPSKGLKFQGHAPNKPSVSDCFWSSSTCDMDHVNTSNRTMNPPSTNADMTNPHEFVNQVTFFDSIFGVFLFLGYIRGALNSKVFVAHLCQPEVADAGLLLWNETRKHWVENKTSQNRNQAWKPRL